MSKYLDQIDEGIYLLATPRQQEVIDAIREHGSQVKASEVLGISQAATTTRLKDAIRTAALRGYDKANLGKPQMLVIDIETAPMRAFMWSLWQHGFGLNMVASDWYMLSWSARWVGAPEGVTIYRDIRDCYDGEDDATILGDLWELLDQADIVIGQNSKRFDVKKINARFILQGYQPPSSFKQIDTLLIAKRQFGFTSNKLEYMTDKLCVKYKKLKHGKYPGMELWTECLKGNPEAWDEMELYNRYDVLSTEELYTILRPWDDTHPNFNLYSESLDITCKCGSTKLRMNGYAYTGLSKFQRYRCEDCGGEVRGRINLLSKDKRKSLRMNVRN